MKPAHLPNDPARADDLGAMAWTEVTSALGADAILAVPVGSCEQHGPHLPLDTDTVIADALAHALARRRIDCVVAPPLAITASGEHQGFAGTLSIGTEALASVLVELARSATWAGGIVFVNGHGGNAEAMRRAEATLAAEGRRALVWWPRVAGSDLHAGRTETSLMLALRADAVRIDAIAAGTTPTPLLAELVRDGVLAHSPSGVLGDPRRATAVEGHELLSELTDDLVRAVAHRWPP